MTTKTIFQDRYPLVSLTIDKRDALFGGVDDIVKYFRKKIAEHPVARFLYTFDHYAHTAGLDNGEIAPGIQAAQNVCFCFGEKLGRAEVLAVRPRSIGICDTGERFVISFLEAPNPAATSAMESWCRELASRRPVSCA